MMPTIEGVHQLVEHGNIGLTAIVVLIMGSFVTVAIAMNSRMNKRLTDAFVGQLEQQRIDFTSELKSSRAEREVMAERQERTTVSLVQVATGVKESFVRFCSRLDSRPCLIGEKFVDGINGTQESAISEDH